MAKQRLQERPVYVTCPKCKHAIAVRNRTHIGEEFSVKSENCGKRSIFHVSDAR
jgi:uncharacterized protein YlaI